MKSPEKRFTFIDIDLLSDLLPDPHTEDLYDETDDMQIERAKEYVLSQLTKAEREVYTLRYESDLSVSEIAQKVGISEDAVRARLHRIKLKVEKLTKNIFSR